MHTSQIFAAGVRYCALILVAGVTSASSDAGVRVNTVIEEGAVDPATYRSPSGRYSLHLEPHSSTDQPNDLSVLGRWSGSYRFYKEDKLLWSEQRPYTLRGVSVTDEGMIVGVVYRSEEDEGGTPYFHVVILRQDGKEVLNHISERSHDGLLGLWHPFARRLMVSDDDGRVVVWVEELNECGNGGSVLWIFDLATGKLLKRFDAASAWTARGRPRARMDDLRWVPDTPLVIFHASVGSRGDLFAVVDESGNAIWSRSIPDDGVAWILRIDEPGMFGFHSSDEPRAVFRARKGKEAGWTVSQVPGAESADSPTQDRTRKR